MTNVLLIICDALRPFNLREWGYHRNTAPFITNLCDTSTVYRNAYASLNYTTASIATILTGEYYQKHGIWRLYYPKFDEEEERHRTIVGYETWKWILHSPTIAEKLNPTHRTIMVNEVLSDLTDKGAVIWKDFKNVPHNYSGHVGERIHPNSNIPVHPTAEQTTEAALIEINKAKENGEEFFAYVHYWDTHWPPSAMKENIEMFYDETNPESLHWWFANRITPDARRMVREQIAARTEKRDLNYLIACYDAVIHEMDKAIERLCKELPDDTLIIITADHGEAMGEHNHTYFGHVESWLYEEVLRVPLIVKYPVEETPYSLGKDDYVHHKVPNRRTVYERVENRKIFNIIENFVLKDKDTSIVSSDYIYAASKASENFTPHLDVLIKDDLKIYCHDFGSETYGFNLKDDPHERNPLLIHNRPEFDELKNLIKPLMDADLPKPEGAV